jgi:hypothetical protein
MNFDICIMLNFISNLVSCKKIMKLHDNMFKIPPIWWPLDGFQHSHHVEFRFIFSLLSKIYEVT